MSIWISFIASSTTYICTYCHTRSLHDALPISVMLGTFRGDIAAHKAGLEARGYKVQQDANGRGGQALQAPPAARRLDVFLSQLALSHGTPLPKAAARACAAR